jgi:hypothetical protein
VTWRQIVCTYLSKDRSRRSSNSSAAEASQDVSRYLAGEPIAAAAPSLGDVIMRLAQRHKAAAAAGIGASKSSRAGSPPMARASPVRNRIEKKHPARRPVRGAEDGD